MKTICIYHSRDLDGWMSAAIIKKWFNENNEDPHFTNLANAKAVNLEPFEEKNNMSFLGWDHGEDVPNLSGYDKVIMADIAFPETAMFYLIGKFGARFIWIDHHISAINDSKDKYDGSSGTRDDKFAACELTWQYFFPVHIMPEIVRLLGRYDCFGHKGTDEEQKVLEFQYGARQAMSDYESCYDFLIAETTHQSDIPAWHDIWKNGITIYQYLCTEARQTYAKAFPITFPAYDSKGMKHDYKEATSKFLCVNQERFNPVNFGIDYHKEGYDGFACFWYKAGKWTWSLYNDNGEVDCSIIAKQFDGGGHKGAAGMVVDDLKEVF